MSCPTETRDVAAARPVTLGQASRIEGVTAGALTALLAHVKRENRKRA
jgi:tRNA uridine 5-carboxymethylaminomethyl modification enzyme